MILKSSYINPEHKKALEELERYLSDIAGKQIDAVEVEGEEEIFRQLDGENTFKFLLNDQGEVIGLRINKFKEKLTDIPETISSFKDSLFCLNLSDNNIINISFLQELINLQKLNLSQNNLEDILLLNQLHNLKDLDLSNSIYFIGPNEENLLVTYPVVFTGNNIKDISPLKMLSELESLNLNGNKITNISPLRNLKKLKFLYLEANKITQINDLSELIKLAKLDLSFNNITEISALNLLTNLKSVRLYLNKITVLPNWIIYKNWFQPLIFSGNPLVSPSWDIVEQGKDAVRRWFEELKKKKVKPRDIKVILLGNTTVGKTTLVNYLLNPNENPDPKNSTHGILVKDWQPKELDGITVHFWDFGGQEYYHATHKYFLSNESIYLLLWNKELNKNNLTGKPEQITYGIHYWLQNISFFAPNRVLAPIFLVQTKAFFNPETKHLDDREEIISDHNIVKEIKKSFAISVLETYSLQLKHERTNSENKIINNFERFKSELFSLIEEQLSYEVPGYWEELRKVIQSARENQKLWTFEYYEKVAKNLDPDIDLEMCTSYLINRGEILYYPDVESLKNTVFIDPLYITQKIYEILRRDLINPNAEFTIDEVKQVIPDEKEAQGFIDLMKAPQFELIFEKPRQKGVFVVPQYLPLENEKIERRLKTLHLAFELRFETYFSLTFINRFISNFGEKAIEHIYSKKGIVFDMEIEGGKEAKFLVYARPEEKIISVYTTSDGLNSVFLSEIKNFFVSFAADTSQLAFRKADTGFENLSIIEKHKLPQYQLRQNPINKVEVKGDNNIVIQDFRGGDLIINKNDEIYEILKQTLVENTKIEINYKIYLTLNNYGIIATDHATVEENKINNKWQK